MGFDVFNLTMRRFGLEWRAGRRIADHSLRPAATLTYRPFLVSKNHELMQQLLRTPDNFVEHLRQYVFHLLCGTTSIALIPRMAMSH